MFGKIVAELFRLSVSAPPRAPRLYSKYSSCQCSVGFLPVSESGPKVLAPKSGSPSSFLIEKLPSEVALGPFKFLLALFGRSKLGQCCFTRWQSSWLVEKFQVEKLFKNVPLKTFYEETFNWLEPVVQWQLLLPLASSERGRISM